MKTNA